MIQLAPIVLSSLALTFPKPLPVVCAMPSAYPKLDGAVLRDDRVNVRQSVCIEANRTARTKEVTRASAWAFAVLTHEQEHFQHPWNTEPQTECRALKDVATLTRLIMPHHTPLQRAFAGRAAVRAERLAREVDKGLPPAYQPSRSC